MEIIPDRDEEAKGGTETSDTLSQMKGIAEKVRAFKENMKKKGIHPQNIIFIGDTGSGKSTLVNYLAGNELEAVKDEFDNEYTIKAPSPLQDIIIGHTPSSTTKIPKWILDENVAYWDCPGFEDTEGASEDITNAYYVNELFKNSKKSRVVLVVSYSTIKGKKFKEFLNLANKIARSGLMDSLESVSLVVTSSKCSKENLINYLETIILPELENKNKENLKKFVQYFTEHSEQVIMFPQPKELGSIDTTNAKAIQKVVKGVTPLSKTVKPVISNDTIITINKYAKSANEAIKGIVEEKISQSITAIFSTVKSGINYSDLKISLNAIKDKSDKLYKSDDEDEIIRTYQKFHNDNRKDEYKTFTENTDLLKLCAFYNPDSKLDLSNFRSASKVSWLCKNLGQQPEIYFKNDGDLFMEHYILGISDVEEVYKANKDKNINSIYVFSHTFSFDSNTEFPGINLCIHTFYVHIDGHITISLKGKDGKKLSIATADDGIGSGRKGKDGIPGNPGMSGGNFYLDCSRKLIKGSLTVDVRGGDGGIGQNGGDGVNGQDGTDSSLHHVQNRDSKCRIQKFKYEYSQKSNWSKVAHVAKMITTFNGQVLEKITCEGEPGEKGGNAGRGGCGGRGGNSGEITINGHIEVKKVKGKGNQGSNGMHGIPGKGGKQGKSCYGEYVGEYIAPGLRGINSKIDEDHARLHCVVDSYTAATGGTIGKLAADQAAKQAAKEAAKQAAKEVAKQTTKEVTMTAAKEVTKTAVTEVSKTAVTEVSKTAVTEVSKTAAKQVAQNAATTSSSGFLAGAATGFGVTVAVQGALSGVSSLFSNGWIVKPKVIDNEETKAEDGKSGDTPSSYNEDGIQEPIENEVVYPKSKDFKTYIGMIKKDFTKIIGEDKMQEWFE